MLFPRSPGFDSPPFVGQTFAETRCLQEPAPCSGYPALPLSTPCSWVRFPAWRSCRSAPHGLGISGLSAS